MAVQWFSGWIVLILHPPRRLMKSNIQPDHLGSDLHPQPAQIAFHHDLLVRLNDAVIVQPLHRLNV